jgi:DedD protein
VFRRKLKLLLLVSPWLAIGCALLDDNAPKKIAPGGLIATPASYYSTAKARYLGGKYKENLDRMVERIVRNPKTSTLQFANNISSVGGIGFFTHSAAKIADERYLEVVLATPETFETKGELSEKVHRLFSQYGFELLGIISGDSDIYQDKELSGYGLNLAWRNILSEPAGNRVTMARAIIYFPKDRVRNFLRHDLNQNELLGNAVIYSVEEDGPLTLISYQPREMRPDFRPAIREDDLASVPTASKATSTQSAPAPGKEPNQKVESKIEVAKKDSAAAKEVSSTVVKPNLSEAKVESKQVEAAQKNSALAKPKGNLGDELEKPKRMPGDAAEQVAISKRTETTEPVAPANKTKAETMMAPELALPLAQEVTPPAKVAKPEPQKVIPQVSPKPASAPMAETARKKVEEAQEPSASPAQKAVVEVKKNEAEVKRIVEGPKPPPAVTASKSVIEAKRPEMMSDDKSPETSVGKSPTEEPISAPQKEEKKSREPPTPVAKFEPLGAPPAARESAPATGKVSQTKGREPIKTEAPAVKSAEAPRPVEAKGAISAPPIAKADVKPQEIKAETSGPKLVPNEEKPNVTPQVAKFEPLVAPLAPVRESAPSTGKVSETKGREPIKTEAPAVKSTERPRPVEAKAAIPTTPIAKAEVKSQEMKAQTSAPKSVPKEEMPNVTPQEHAPVRVANENKTADPKAPEKVAPAPIVTPPIQSPSEKMKAVSTTEMTKVETPVPAPRSIENVPAQAKSPQANVSGVVASPAPSAKPTTDPPRPREASKPDLGPSVAKAPVTETKPLPPVVTAPPREISAEKPNAEQIALLKKPADIVPEKRPMARPEPKALEGFIIQLGFNDKEKARRWAEAMERRGYAVSITEAGAEAALRVRLGNFALREEAERQLRSFKQEGLSGIIINLPQGFRPEARSSIP